MKRKSNSSFFAPSKKPLGSYASCPICSSSISLASMSAHLDKCLLQNQQNDFDSKHSATCSTPLPAPSSSSKKDKFSALGERMEKGPIPGLIIFKDFLSPEEGDHILKMLDSEQSPEWHFSSFNGNCLSKMYGYRTQWGLPNEDRLVRVNLPEKGEHNIPQYLWELFLKLQLFIKNENPQNVPTVLQNFKPNECNANKYIRSKNHYLTAHFDDRILSGPVLMNVSLAGDGYMTYFDKDNKEVDVFLPMNCLQLVTGKSR